MYNKQGRTAATIDTVSSRAWYRRWVECDRKEAGCRVPERDKEQQCDDGYRTRVLVL
jgi:hypothetical protein